MIKLLKEMLQFNPSMRPTAKECLQSPIFDQIRVPGLEQAAPFKINIEVDRNELKFDYDEESCSFRDMDHSELIYKFKNLVLEEIAKLKPSDSN